MGAILVQWLRTANMGLWVGLVIFCVVLGFGLSLWIVIPAPIFSLLPLSVGAPEISPWLMGFNTLALVGSLMLLKGFPMRPMVPWWILGLLAMSTIALTLSSIPLRQLGTTQQAVEQQMERALGADYEQQIPAAVRARLRSQPFSLFDHLRGIPIPKVRETPGIIFASPDDVPLTLNLYRPEQVGTYPAIVSIYGGGWQRGSADNDGKFNRYLAAQGYAVWSISYRHAPQYRFPAQLEDVVAAIAFIRDHASDYETDLERVALVGRSAGAQLAMLAGYGASPVPMRAVVNYYGPVNLTEGYNHVPVPDPIESRSVLETFLGGTPTEVPQLYQQASPISAVKPGLPPSLLIYGGRDNVVQAKYGAGLARALEAEGNPVVLLTIPWADHAFDVVFQGVSNQLALHSVERFLAWSLQQ